MKHERLLRRDDGSRVKIRVELTTDFTSDVPRWKWNCLSCAAGCRTWTPPVSQDDFAWRRLSYEDRQLDERRRSLLLVSESEVAETMRELIALIVPSV